jgi:uridine kinase
MTFYNLLQKYKKKIIVKNKVSYITIDGLTCSGKTTFTKKLALELKKKNKVIIISKDFFLKSRNKRILISKNFSNYNPSQNQLHYDLKKLKMLLNFFNKDNLNKKITLTNLYNRKTGRNNLKLNFLFKKNIIILFEGLYVNDDLKNVSKPILKILIIENVYRSLIKKIERIRDKKISINLVVKEFIKIHLLSFKNYLKKNKFDLIFQLFNENYKQLYSGKNKQLELIRNFISKHNY